MDLETYNRKRNFRKTREPQGQVAHSPAGNRYLIQKHAASHLHYDFRLEVDGVLKSWAIPKGPSLNPTDKRLAVRTEDHPLAYGDFEGIIPQGEYGGGTVMLWDTGTWEPDGKDTAKAMKAGKLDFTLHGERLKGTWHLTRMKPRKGEKRENWLLIKGRDDHAAEDGEKLVRRYTTSAVTNRNMQDIAAEKGEKPESFAFSPPPKAKQAAMPDFIQPQLATLENDAPDGGDWIHEIKYDGYRLQLHKDGDKAICLTRRGLDWSARFPKLCAALRSLPMEQAIIDGEVVVLNAQGVSDFKALQNALQADRESPVHFYAFDLLYCDGHDLRKSPLLERKKALEALVTPARKQNYITYSDHIVGKGDDVYANSCTMALEGIISKRAKAAYHSGRNRDWLKSKCSKRQEFVIGGFQKPTRGERGIGSLLLGYYDGKRFRYAGKVGTGFTNASGTSLRGKLDRLVRESPAFDGPLPTEARNAVWVRPELVGEIEFTEWTEAGALRHPSFLGLREDKPAREVVRELPDDNVEQLTPMPDVRITSPDKVLWPSQGLTKQDLAEYYHRVAELMLPYVSGRPISLVRCPEGREEACFFQRHHGRSFPKAIGTVAIQDDGKTEHYLTIADETGLLSLVQVGTLEVHAWGARNDDPDRPDTLIFDMDPAEDVPLERVKQAALEAKERLEALGLQCFLKATGGKGLHVVAPLERRQDWPTLKGFAKAFAEAMVADSPERYIAVATKAKRKGKIFVDYLRNGKAASAVAPYSTRAREGAPVALPLAWQELDGLPATNFYQVSNLQRRLAHLKADPWADYHRLRQNLTKTMLKQYKP